MGQPPHKLSPLERKKLVLLEKQKRYRRHLRLAFDAKDLSSRATPKQNEILRAPPGVHYIVASNRAGKSQMGARIVAWHFNNDHPFHQRPTKWGNGPITILMVGRVGEQMESELWANKIEPFLEPGSYHIHKPSANIAHIQHKENKNKIIFISHHDPEAAREKAQAYTAQIVWLDEMPSKVGVLNELRARVFDSDGWMYCTFTPLIKNVEIVKMIDTPSERATKWFISVLDNPKFADKTEAQIIEEFRALSASESEFQARMYGKWMTSDHNVFSYDSERNFRNPVAYEPHIWPHTMVVDPAASGLVGVTIWAREPTKDVWYCMMAKTLNGSAFSTMIPELENIAKPFNIVRRICDCNPSAFYHEAQVQKISYVAVADKKNNKENSIDLANMALATQDVFLTDGAQILIDELVRCQRSETNPDRIIQASTYHTADTFRYFLMEKPRFTEFKPAVKPQERVRRDWKNYLTRKAKHDKKVAEKQQRTTVRFSKMRRRWI
jgi:hypothetical protein